MTRKHTRRFHIRPNSGLGEYLLGASSVYDFTLSSQAFERRMDYFEVVHLMLLAVWLPLGE